MQSFPDQPNLNQLLADDDLRIFIKLACQAVFKQTALPTDVFEIIQQFFDEIDQELSVQLNEIIHHPDFKTLESAWQSLHFLVNNSDLTYRLKVRMMHLTKNELHRDFERSIKFDQSIIFKKIHDDEYGAFAGQPYSVIIGNYEFDFSPSDMLILENFGEISAECYAPFISSVAVEAINSNLQNPIWQSFRQTYEAKFVSLCAPKFLLRNIYADKHEFDKTIPVELFGFTEKINSKEDYLWGNSAFAFGVKLTEIFSKYKWCALIEGEERGIISANAANIKVPNPQEFHQIIYNSLEQIWTPEQEAKLREAGFNIVSNYFDKIRFLQANSCAEPLQSDDVAENQFLKEFVSLPFTFAVARFVHHLKKMVLNDNGNRTIGNWRKFLNEWISQYVKEEGRNRNAQRPLEQGHIEIYEDHWTKTGFETEDVLDAEIIYDGEESTRLSTVNAELCIRPCYQLPLTTFDSRFTIRNLPVGMNEEPLPKAEEIQADLPDYQVNISYQTEYYGKMESLELPFVLGVIGNFVGNPSEPLPRPMGRKFIEIDMENFDDVIAAFKPRVNFKVKNTLKNAESELEIELNFKCFEDFSPDNIVRQIQPLQELIKTREHLQRVFNKLDGNFRLEDFLQGVLDNPTLLHQLSDKIDTNF